MQELSLIGTTDASGNLTITKVLQTPMTLVLIKWDVGNFATGVDATVVAKGAADEAAAAGVATSVLDRTLATLTDANANSFYTPGSNAVVDREVTLNVTSGGNAKTGGITLYFTDAVSNSSGGTSDATAANQTALNTLIGPVTETAPIGDTNSSGLNGRLQRLAQRITSLIALLPASLGQKAKSAALAVTLASDEDLLAATGAVGDAAATAGSTGSVSSKLRLGTTLWDAINTVLGATADAVVTAGAAGSISAKLRAISRDLVANIVLAAGENHIGQVSGHSASIVPTITGSTSPAYSSGDSLGGKITLSNAVRVTTGTGWLVSLQIADASNQKPTGTVLIFGADPTGTTYTDNANAALTTADANRVVAQISVSTGDYVSINNRSLANLLFNPKQLKAASGTTLYMLFVLTSTPTLAATGDVQMTLGIAQD